MIADKATRAAFGEVLNGLFRFYHKTPTAPLARAYWNELRHLELEQVEELLERLYASPPRGLPTPKQLRYIARGDSAHNDPRVPQFDRRRYEVAWLRSRLDGTTPPKGPPPRLLPIATKGRGMTPVDELDPVDCRAWLEHFERQQREEPQPDPLKARLVREAIGS